MEAYNIAGKLPVGISDRTNIKLFKSYNEPNSAVAEIDIVIHRRGNILLCYLISGFHYILGQSLLERIKWFYHENSFPIFNIDFVIRHPLAEGIRDRSVMQHHFRKEDHFRLPYQLREPRVLPQTLYIVYGDADQQVHQNHSNEHYE